MALVTAFMVGCAATPRKVVADSVQLAGVAAAAAGVVAVDVDRHAGGRKFSNAVIVRGGVEAIGFQVGMMVLRNVVPTDWIFRWSDRLWIRVKSRMQKKKANRP